MIFLKTIKIWTLSKYVSNMPKAKSQGERAKESHLFGNFSIESNSNKLMSKKFVFVREKKISKLDAL